MTNACDLPQRLSREPVFESEYLTLHIDRVRQPNGFVIERFHYVEDPHPAVGVVVEDELGRVVLVRVPRYTNNSCSWTVPAGGVDTGEDPLLAAKREVREETGFESSEHRLVYSYYPQLGSSNKHFLIVFCKAGAQTGEFDPDEIREVAWFTRDEIEGMINRGEIEDGCGFTALLMWLRESAC
jgi:ADP-ribose pyrophosphatase